MQRQFVATFPSSDRAFRRAATQLAEGLELGSAEELAGRLRPMFPRVAVFEQQLSGESRRFYAYRDGHYDAGPREAWWRAPDTLRARVSARTGRLIAVSEAAARLLGLDLPHVIGCHFTAFIQPAAGPIAAAMFEALEDEREVVSEALLVRPDGSELLIEFRAVQQDGEIEVSYRPVPGRSGPAT